MPDTIGPHLLGRLPSPPDARDFKMSDEIAKRAAENTDYTPYLDQTLRQILEAGVIKSWYNLLDFWRWVKAWLKGNQPTPSPTPTPTPTPVPVSSKEWADAVQLDQGNTGHCVGFGTTAYLNAEPMTHSYQNQWAHDLYYWIKANIDGEPGAEDGSYVRSAAKALVQKGFISKYFFATTVDDIKTWVLNHGPVVMGTDWDNAMFTPDAWGYIKPGGGVAGGHCFLLIGYDAATDSFEFDNSWGTGWGKNGRFFMYASDFAKLFGRVGSEAMAADEVV
jgi:hypothetical protein